MTNDRESYFEMLYSLRDDLKGYLHVMRMNDNPAIGDIYYDWINYLHAQSDITDYVTGEYVGRDPEFETLFYIALGRVFYEETEFDGSHLDLPAFVKEKILSINPEILEVIAHDERERAYILCDKKVVCSIIEQAKW